MKLYSYWRSTAAYRVRIALNLKKVQYDIIPVHLVKNGGEQLGDKYKEINPQKIVPALETKESGILTQSMAIIEYLDEVLPGHSLLPDNAVDRAFIRSLSQLVCCDIHPINNLRVLKYLTGEMLLSQDQKSTWYAHWVLEGLSAFEQRLKKRNVEGQYCLGSEPGMADCCLVSQLYNAHRFDISIANFSEIRRIEENCLKLEAFDRARPENQVDAEPV
ncbi:maleylacetoacetate isomerase [Kiloniella litopenaei]|uniref:Maleylacetoacetate isomerase n=1 Tax=Kiloniella litopenaei TaxID=1549748 RepID=A0A0M2R4J8_9PROT|nr:maleylacetoacetate isomerase [Kiloniella litopenaei]KKJ76772.1 maleylacetoacetate isomerase [Kiloniella litopenaei]